MAMNIILLSGGSGKRLWPLSNEVRSKQFLKIFRKADGTRESMVQRMYRMIKEVDSAARITIATSANQIPQIQSQIGKEVGISVEPGRRDTFPAIALAVAYLAENGVGRDEPVVVCPVDPYVEEDYFERLKELSDEAGRDGAANLTLMGIEPNYPSEKYGYILPTSAEHLSPVSGFKEKPDAETAKRYIASGALWNGGVFAFKASYVLDLAASLLGSCAYQELYENYGSFQKISFDYAVVEKEASINVIRFPGNWKDLGTWNTFTEGMEMAVTGNVVANDCENTHLINELSIPIVALGIKNAVIVATPDGILVSDKKQSSTLKDYVSDQRPMYERRTWGEYKVLEYKVCGEHQNSLTKELIIEPEQHISYQRHKHRTEVWTFTEGNGELVLEDEVLRATRGDVAVIKPGMKHGIKAVGGELHIIEIQIGDELSEDDIERLDWNW